MLCVRRCEQHFYATGGLDNFVDLSSYRAITDHGYLVHYELHVDEYHHDNHRAAERARRKPVERRRPDRQ